MSTRQNDWAAVLLNISNTENIDLGEDPMKTLYGNGITPENTELKDEDYYKNIPQVVNSFTKNGEFDEAAYKQFYDSALRSYNEFSETPFLENMLDDIGVTSYDSSRLYNPAKVKDLNAVIMPWHDRNRSTYGTANIWEKGSKTFSDREVAQANFVRDENGNKLDWTPNDKAGLFSGLFAPSLVYATYTEDVFDKDGKLIHQKGETKLDENGDPYTELLGDRPAYGQDIVKWTDIMTVDGSWWNKYVDVFDSDSLEKSMGKTIAKTALMLTPYFTPIGSAMGWINATIGLTTALPSLVKSLDGLLLGGSDSKFMDSMTKLENVMGRFKPSVSDESRGKFFSMENIGDLLISSSGQLFSQRNIANSLYKLQPFNNPKTNQKFAELMSTGYMALTSVSDVYGEMKTAGANDRIAGLGSLLSLGGFFTLLQHGYFKNKLFEGSLLDEDQRTLHSLKNLITWATAKVFSDPKSTATQEATKEGLKKAWGLIKNKLKDVATGTSYGANAFISRSINEGLEETTEEIMMDAVKWMAKGLEYLNIPVSEDNQELNFGRTFGNTMERWGTSFLGGFLGGAVFEFHNQRELYKDPNYLKWRNATPLKQMYQYVAEGKADKLRDMIIARGKKGKNGNKNLSASYKTGLNSKNETVQMYGTGTDSDNQNVAMTNALLALIDNAESIYARHNLIWNNNDLLKQVLGSKDLQSFIKENELSDSDLVLRDAFGDKNVQNAIVDAILDLKDDEGNNIGEEIAANVLQNINSIRNEIFDLETKLDIENNRSSENGTKKPRDKHIKNLTDRRNSLVKKFESLINGEQADSLLTQLLMFFKGNPLEQYMGFGAKPDVDLSINNIERYSDLVLNIDYNAADDELKQYIEEEYRDFLSKKEHLFRRVADLHITLSDLLRNDLKIADDNLKDSIVSDKYTRGKTRQTILQASIELKEEVNVLAQQLSVTDPNTEDFKILKSRYDKSVAQHAYFVKLMEQNGDMTMDQWFDYSPISELETAEVQKAKQQSVLDFYKDAIKSKALFVDNKFLMSYLSKVDFSGITQNLHEIIENYESKEGEISPYLNLSHLSDDLVNSLMNNFGQNIISQLQSGDISLYDLYDQFDDGDLLINELSANNIFNPDLESKIAEFIYTLQGSPIKIKQTYQNLIKYLDDRVDFEMLQKLDEFKGVKNGKDFLHKIFDPAGLNDILSFVNEVIDQLEKLPTSPVYEWIQKVHSLLFGSNSKIFDIIQNERKNISSVGVENYILGEAAKKDIENSEAVLNIIFGLVEASSPANLNEIINSKRSGYKNPDGSNKEDFTIISENTKEVIRYELEFLRSQLLTLKQISERNEGNKIEEDKNIAKVDAVKRFNAIVSPKEGTFGYVIHNILKSSGFDFTPYDNNYDVTTVKNWQSATYDEFYKLEFAFKSALNKHFLGLSDEDKKKLLEDLAEQGSVFTTVLNMEIDAFSDDINQVGDWGLIRYFLANLTTDYSEFSSHYKLIVDQQGKILPFYGQEFVIRDAYSSFIASKHYNTFMSALHKNFISKNKGTNYAEGMKFIKNFLFIDGVPGSGKTTAVASIYAKVLKSKLGKDLTVITLTHTNNAERIKTFGDIIGSSESHRFTHTDFVKKFICTDVDKTSKGDNGHSNQYNDKNLINQNELKKIANTDHILIISDEHTFANEEQLKAFSEYANQSDQHIYLLGLGDLFQSGVSDTSDITDTYFQSSVRLTTTFRAANNGKAKNERIVRDLLFSPVQEWSSNRIIKLSEISKKLYDNLSATLTKTPLIGYENKQTGEIYGDVKVSKESLADKIVKLKSITIDDRPAKIAIVADNPAEYESYKDENTSVKNPTEIQGEEYDYVIADVDVALYPDTEKNYAAFKKFYTIMTRAKLGTIWTDKLSSHITPELDSDAQRPVSQDMKMNSMARNNYVEFRKHLFDLVGVTESPETVQNINNEENTTTLNIPPETKNDEFKNINSNNEIYTGIKDGDVEYFREKYYERDAEDVGDFAKSHSKLREEYKKRKIAINDGTAFDYDTWIKFIDNKENLKDDCYGYNESNYQTYKQFLYQFNAILMDYLSMPNRDWVSDFESKLLASELNTNSEINKIIRAIISDQASKFVIKKKNNSIVVYYEFKTDDETASIPITALSNNKVNETRINSAYLVKNTSTNISTKMIPISSAGERFVRPDDIRPTINWPSRVLVFKGYDNEEAESKLTEGAKKWNGYDTHRGNRGKVFACIGNLSHNLVTLDLEAWPQELTPTVNDDNKIEYFIDQNIDDYMQLAGIQRICTVKTFSDIVGKMKDAYFASTVDEYMTICDSVAESVGRPKGTIKLAYYKKLNEDVFPNANSMRSIFPHATWRYLQAIAVSVATENNNAFRHLQSWLNKTNRSNNQCIKFNFKNDYKASITVYNNDKGEIFVTSGLNTNDNAINITDIYQELSKEDNLKSMISKLLLRSMYKLSEDEDEQKYDSKNIVEYYKNMFNLKSDNDVAQWIKTSIENAEFEIDFGYIADNSFKHSDPAFIFLPTTNQSDNQTVFDFMLTKADKFRSGRVHLNIYADEHGSGSLDAYGTAKWVDGMGFDIVEVLPTNYSFNFGDRTSSEHRYSNDSDVHGITHHNKTYHEVGNEFHFDDGPVVNSEWLNLFIPSLASSGNEYQIKKVVKNNIDGKEVYKVVLIVDNNEMLYEVDGNMSWLGEYKSVSKSFGHFKSDKNGNVTYKGNSFTLIAFNEDRTKCLIQQDKSIFEVDIFSDNATDIGSTDKEYIYYENDFAVTTDSSKNAYLFYINPDTTSNTIYRNEALRITENKLNDMFTVSDDVLLSINNSIGSNKLQKQKDTLKASVNQIIAELLNAEVSQDVLEPVIVNINSIINTMNIGGLNEVVEHINNIFEENAYKFFAKYQIENDGSISTVSNPYNIARLLKLDNIISINRLENQKILVSLSDGTNIMYQENNGIFEEIVPDIDDKNSRIEKLKTILSGIDINLVNDFIVAIESNDLMSQDDLYNQIIYELNPDLLEEFDQLIGEFNKLCSK